MKSIIYFHGYNSSSNSRTGKLLTEKYSKDGYNIITPGYDSKNPEFAITYLTEVVRTVESTSDKTYLVGTSLGGFFANYFSNKYCIPAVLINPCLDPHISLKKYTPVDTIDCDGYQKYYIPDTPGVPKVVVLGVKDSVIPYRKHIDRLSKYKIFINTEMEHRVSDISEIAPAIDGLVNTVAL